MLRAWAYRGTFFTHMDRLVDFRRYDISTHQVRRTSVSNISLLLQGRRSELTADIPISGRSTRHLLRMRFVRLPWRECAEVIRRGYVKENVLAALRIRA